MVIHTLGHAGLQLHVKLLTPCIYRIFGLVIAIHGAPGQAVLELLQLAGHQGLGLIQRCMAALNALVHLLHGRLAFLTTGGAAPAHKALHLPDILPLQTLHHGVHRLLHPELLLQLRHGDPRGSLIFLKMSLVLPILLFSSIFLHCSLQRAFFSLLATLCNSALRWVYLYFPPLPFTSFLSYL